MKIEELLIVCAVIFGLIFALGATGEKVQKLEKQLEQKCLARR